MPTSTVCACVGRFKAESFLEYAVEKTLSTTLLPRGSPKLWCVEKGCGMGNYSNGEVSASRLWMCLSCSLCYCEKHRVLHSTGGGEGRAGNKTDLDHCTFLAVTSEACFCGNDARDGLTTLSVALSPEGSGGGCSASLSSLTELKNARVTFTKEQRGFVFCTRCSGELVELSVRCSQPSPEVISRSILENVAKVLYCCRENIRLGGGLSEGSCLVNPASCDSESSRLLEKGGNSKAPDAYSSAETAKHINTRLPMSSSISRSRTNYRALREAGLVGFENEHNTCYFNAVLQCVLQCPTFRDFMMNCKDAPESAILVRDMCDLMKFLDGDFDPHQRHGVNLLTRSLIMNLAKLVPMFGDGDQQDSQELFITLINGIMDELDKGKSSEEKNRSRRVPFEGIMRTTITCDGCKNQVSRNEVFMALSIPVTRCVKESLGKLFEETTLNGSSQYACEECFEKLSDEAKKRENDATRRENEARKKKKATAEAKSLNCLYRDANVRTTIAQFNGSLALHLLRFKCDERGVYKVPGTVNFPMALDVSEFMVECASAKSGLGGKPSRATEREPSSRIGHCGSRDGGARGHSRPETMLQLVGIVSHTGSIHGGHYVAYVRSHRIPSMWFFCDDDDISLVEESHVLRQTNGVYMLFYDKLSG